MIRPPDRWLLTWTDSAGVQHQAKFGSYGDAREFQNGLCQPAKLRRIKPDLPKYERPIGAPPGWAPKAWAGGATLTPEDALGRPGCDSRRGRASDILPSALRSRQGA